MDWISSHLSEAQNINALAYGIALLAALLETTIGIGLIIPGSTLLLFMGALSANSYFNIAYLILFAAIGAVIGDNINYIIGKKISSKILDKGWWVIRPKHLKKGERFFHKYGSKSVFMGRFIPSLKEITPLIAGIFSMNRASFYFWNILGAIGWSLAWILPGYFLGQSFGVAQIWLTRSGLLLLSVFAFFAGIYLLELFLARNGKQIVLFFTSIGASVARAISENPEVRKMKEKHASLFLFFNKRLRKNHFFGLPLTTLSLLFLYVLLLFIGILRHIISAGLILDTDLRVANLLAIFRDWELVQFFFWVTLLGQWQVVLVVFLATIVIFWLRGKRDYILPLFVSVVGSQFFTWLFKIIFHRTRPDSAVYNEHSFSFPSAHSSIAVAFYGFLIYVALKKDRSWKGKINILFLGLVLIFLIGLSRLYLGVHFLTDVWGGYLLGALWLIIGIAFSEFLIQKKGVSRLISVSSKTFWPTFFIVLGTLVFYVFFALHFTPQVLPILKPPPNVVVSQLDEIFKEDRIKYTETLFGNTQEPLSFIIVAKDEKSLIQVFNQAGWRLADPLTLSTLWEVGKAALWKESYPSGPMTPDFWNTKVHDLGFEKETDLSSVRQRHHARFWKTDYVTQNGDSIYVGTASFDDSIKWAITHRISPDIDTERDFLMDELRSTGAVKDLKEWAFVQPVLGKNFAGDAFFTDGNLYTLIIE